MHVHVLTCGAQREEQKGELKAKRGPKPSGWPEHQLLDIPPDQEPLKAATVESARQFVALSWSDTLTKGISDNPATLADGLVHVCLSITLEVSIL